MRLRLSPRKKRASVSQKPVSRRVMSAVSALDAKGLMPHIKRQIWLQSFPRFSSMMNGLFLLLISGMTEFTSYGQIALYART